MPKRAESSESPKLRETSPTAVADKQELPVAPIELDSLDSSAGAPQDGPPLAPKPVPGKDTSASQPPRVKIPKEKKLKTAKSIGKAIQRAVDKANTIAVLTGTGLEVDFALVEKPSIPVDYRHGKDGLELVYVDGPGQAIAYHAQELGLDKVDSLLKLIDDNPRAIALLGIVGAIAVNAYHVRSVTIQHANMVRRAQDIEQRQRIRNAEETPVEGFARSEVASEP